MKLFSPASNELEVDVDARVQVNFTSVREDEGTFWGEILGGPSMSTISSETFQVPFSLSPSSFS